MLPKTRHYRVVERSKEPEAFENENCIIVDYCTLGTITLLAGLLGLLMGLLLSHNK